MSAPEIWGHSTGLCIYELTDAGMGNLRKCGMRKVICGMKSAE